ncbi:MAG: hypothetical protein CMI52_02030, partial [Parcubacteria group bacterium]|nr:hypothetical protein [Parcubacteria group bacterium]
LESIDTHADIPCEVIVVDNASEDESVAMLRSFSFSNDHVEMFNVFESQKNLGFAQGCNLGIDMMISPHALLLNPDARIRKNTLSKSIAFIEDHSDAGVIGCKIENEDGSKQGSAGAFPTIRGQIARRLGLTKTIGHTKYFSVAPKGKWNENKEMQVDHVKGAFFLITKKALHNVGKLDGNIFLWFEETDYCLRTWRAGLKVYYTPSIAITHIGGASFKKVGFWKKQSIWNKSIRYYFTKHHGLLSGLLIAILDPICLAIGAIKKRIT